MKPSVSLIPLSTIYSAVTRMRLAAYQRGWFSVARLPVPVVSVGNLTTGGTGKTPLVEWVCRAIANSGSASGVWEGKRICVLTRGYGRESPKTQVVVSNGIDLLAGERDAGDEPFLLARNLLGIAAVIANPNRVAAGQWALEELNTEVFVLDDGFQHLRLARDLDIVTIDATNPWGGGSLLPYGRLREPRSGLSRADCIVLTRAAQVEDSASIKKAVERLAGAVPIFSAHMETSRIRRLEGEDVDQETLQAEQLGAFCGVGNPQSFFSHLRHEGIALAFTHAFSDHHNYKQLELEALVKEARARGAIGLITTAKDATRLSSLKLELPCYVLEIQIRIGEEDRLIEIIRKTAYQDRER
ncbi:MAG TPA: tetraacyldisaccharide 4'-kinase [Pyrinomonadaceae bacterium]